MFGAREFENWFKKGIGTRKGQRHLMPGHDSDSEYESKDTFREIEHILCKFRDGTRLGGSVDLLERRKTLQRDLGSLGQRDEGNCMRIKRGKKGWVLPLETINPSHHHKLGEEWLESCSAERGLEVLFDSTGIIKNTIPDNIMSSKSECLVICIEIADHRIDAHCSHAMMVKIKA
ncbi:hypothetical protein BTVI_49477 [Pitangus sulphuratus]|nr:hypothetical protein BTVI_49477 [Pitangus sulphuratus]